MTFRNSANVLPTLGRLNITLISFYVREDLSEHFRPLVCSPVRFIREKNPNHKKGTQEKRGPETLYILPNFFDSKCNPLVVLIIALAFLFSSSAPEKTG